MGEKDKPCGPSIYQGKIWWGEELSMKDTNVTKKK